MLFRKTVRATTVDQLESAFDRADRIVVEGNDELLAYAACRAAGVPETVAQPKRGPASPSPDPDPSAPADVAGALPPSLPPFDGDRMSDPFAHVGVGSAMPPSPVASSPAPRAAASFPLRWLALAALIVVAIGAFTLRDGFRSVSPANQATPATAAPVPDSAPIPAPSTGGDTESKMTAPSPPPDAAPAPPLDQTAEAVPGSSGGRLPLSGLVWPFVALVALVLMYLLARQAIAGGSNVKLEWKVTEKVSGRIVITKVRKA